MTSIRVNGCVLENLSSVWQNRLVDESWGSDPIGGPGGRVTATRGRMTSIVLETL